MGVCLEVVVELRATADRLAEALAVLQPVAEVLAAEVVAFQQSAITTAAMVLYTLSGKETI
jgi:hypothetical protein